MTTVAAKPAMTDYPNALVLTPSMAYLDWQDLGVRMVYLEGALPFMIGDWLNYGDIHFGENAPAAYPEHWQRRESTLRKYAWVCGSVRRDLRIELAEEYPGPDHPLTFSHYEAVARLPEEQQAMLLRMAAADTWSVRRLRSAVANLPEDATDNNANGQQVIIQARAVRELEFEPATDGYAIGDAIAAALMTLETQLPAKARITGQIVTVRLDYTEVLTDAPQPIP